jgi:acetyl-CoA C-acetyltransferase
MHPGEGWRLKMNKLRKKIYAAAGFNTIFMGPGRKEFNLSKPMRPFEEYLKETAEGTCEQLSNVEINEGLLAVSCRAVLLSRQIYPDFCHSWSLS